MNKLFFSDMRRNIKLFFGTCLAIAVTSCIICSCLNLVFSSVAAFDYGKRFEGVDVSVIPDQNITIAFTESDGDLDSDSENIAGRRPFTEEELAEIVDSYETVLDYTFFVQIPNSKSTTLAGHNYSALALSGFSIHGTQPDAAQLVVDEDFAKKNNLEIGDLLYINTNSGSFSYEISGIAFSNTSDIYKIQNFLFFDDDTAKALSNGCQSVGIITGTPELVAKNLESKGYQTYTGSNKNKAELPHIAQNDISLMVIFVTMGSVCLVISLFVIGSTVQFSIKNRYRTLAQLRVIGLKKGQIKRGLAVQTALIGLLGAIAGALFAIPTAKLIVAAYEEFGIVGSNFAVTHSWLWDSVVIAGILLLLMLVTAMTANKPLSVPPASAMKDENKFTGKISLVQIIFGIVLVFGGAAILIFAPMTNGIGIGMAFCASSVFLGGAICLTPIIMKIFNVLFSIITSHFAKSLGQVANANIKMKASKFAVAAVSISIMMTMGTIMLLNNITYMDSYVQKQYNMANHYSYVLPRAFDYEIVLDNSMALKNTKLVYNNHGKLTGISSLAAYKGIPNVEVVQKEEEVQGNIIWVSDKFKHISVGDTLDFWLEDGTPIALTVGGIFSQAGIQDETLGCIIDYATIKSSLYDSSFDLVYTNTPAEYAYPNTIDYYKNSPSYDIQLGASLLLGTISLLLSIVALFNTFAVIMSVRKKEFHGLKVIGAKKFQIFKMTLIETLIVTVTGMIIGFIILAACVGLYSKANIGVFDFVVQDTMFYSTVLITALLGLLAGIIPSVLTIAKLKRQFRTE